MVFTVECVEILDFIKLFLQMLLNIILIEELFAPSMLAQVKCYLRAINVLRVSRAGRVQIFLLYSEGLLTLKIHENLIGLLLLALPCGARVIN